jgi:omega-6 fatty acid desaturase (delta-12 desaturase)
MTVEPLGGPSPGHVDLYGNVLRSRTMKQIHDAIPAHYSRPSILRSMCYVVRYYILLCGLAWLTYTYTPVLLSIYLRAISYSFYTVVAGMIMTECGHGAFSQSKTLNNMVGFILHSSLLMPYCSWKISHSHHHKAAGDSQRDAIVIPHSRE